MYTSSMVHLKWYPQGVRSQSIFLGYSQGESLCILVHGADPWLQAETLDVISYPINAAKQAPLLTNSSTSAQNHTLTT